jgi:hypothetical protein
VALENCRRSVGRRRQILLFIYRQQLRCAKRGSCRHTSKPACPASHSLSGEHSW